MEWERLEISSRILEIPGNISCKDGHNKEQKWYGPNRQEDIKKQWQNNTEQPYKKEFNDPDNHDGVVIDLEPDILGCKVQRSLGSITRSKASGDDGIPVELFQILKDDAVKVLHLICQQIWKTQQWPQDWKRVRFYSNPNERQCQRLFKLLHNCTFVSHANKVIPKILQARLQHT